VTKTTALRTSIDKASSRSRLLSGPRKLQHGATSVHPLLRLQQCIGNRAAARLIQAKLQKRQPGRAHVRVTDRAADTAVLIQRESEYDKQLDNRTSQAQNTKKPNLEFHSALHFNRGFSGFNPTREPEEGESAIIWWSVWNTGWTTAPEHTNRLTIYDANLCSGCRKEEDEIFRSDISAPSIVSGEQQGKSEYENAVLVGMAFKAGHYEAVVDLDVHNQVDEMNEDNNRAFLVFSVRPGRASESAVEETVQRKVNAGHDDAPVQLARGDLIQRQPKPDGPSVRDVPILLEKLELDVGENLLDYGHHLYRAATLYPDDPDALKAALGRYALGANLLKDTYRFFGFKADTAGKLAVGTGIVTKGVTLLRTGELTLDFQVDIGRGVKFETNLNLGVNPKDLTHVRKAEVHFGLVRRF